MTLSDLASIGSLVSGVAVLASLVFLYHQLRQIGAQIKQAEKNQMASIRSERTSRTLSTLNALIEPSMADAYYKGMAADEDMSPTQIRQFSTYCMSWFYNVEDAFSQHAEGLLDELAYANMRAGLKRGLSAPGLRHGWHICRGQFDTNGDFVAFVDGLLAETPVGVGLDLIAQWRAGSAAVKASTADR